MLKIPKEELLERLSYYAGYFGARFEVREAGATIARILDASGCEAEPKDLLDQVGCAAQLFQSVARSQGTAGRDLSSEEKILLADLEQHGFRQIDSHFGWIAADERDRLFLESLGVELGSYSDELGHFIARVPAPALDALQDYWGSFVWGLHVHEFECLRDSRVLNHLSGDDLAAERFYILWNLAQSQGNQLKSVLLLRSLARVDEAAEGAPVSSRLEPERSMVRGQDVSYIFPSPGIQ